MAKLSALSTVMTIRDWVEFERKFKDRYKRDEGTAFKGNVAQYITTGVIQRKRLPDVEDEITLIKLLNNNATDEQAYAILGKWLEDEENKERGIAGAFCDSCKDLSQFVPMHSMVVGQINELESSISNMQDALNQFTKLFEKLGDITNKLSDNTDELGEVEESTQEEN